VECEVLFTDEFGAWWDGLTTEEQDAVDRVVGLLEMRGTALGFPYSSGIVTSAYPYLRELRIQHSGQPYRVLYAFDPKRKPFYCWAASRPAKSVGTKFTFPSRTGFTRSISAKWKGSKRRYASAEF
jgi:hypothetical protein